MPLLAWSLGLASDETYTINPLYQGVFLVHWGLLDFDLGTSDN